MSRTKRKPRRAYSRRRRSTPPSYRRIEAGRFFPPPVRFAFQVGSSICRHPPLPSRLIGGPGASPLRTRRPVFAFVSGFDDPRRRQVVAAFSLNHNAGDVLDAGLASSVARCFAPCGLPRFPAANRPFWSRSVFAPFFRFMTFPLMSPIAENHRRHEPPCHGEGRPSSSSCQVLYRCGKSAISARIRGSGTLGDSCLADAVGLRDKRQEHGADKSRNRPSCRRQRRTKQAGSVGDGRGFFRGNQHFARSW